MSKQTKAKQIAPIQYRPDPEAEAKLRKIAEANGLSRIDVVKLAVVCGMHIVEAKLAELKNPPPTEKAA